MKRLMIASSIFLSMLLAAPAWSHHPAEGIVSDEIWQMVDDLLVEADSPHLDIVFDDDMGQLSMLTSVVVDDAEVDELLVEIYAGLDDIIENNRVMNSDPSDTSSTETNRDSAVYVETIELDDDVTRIEIYEPIGMGSQTLPSNAPGATGS